MVAGYKNRYILELLNIYAYFCRLKDMKPAYYIKNPAIASEEALLRLLAELEEGGSPAYRVANRTELSALQPDMLLAVGGDSITARHFRKNLLEYDRLRSFSSSIIKLYIHFF